MALVWSFEVGVEKLGFRTKTDGDSPRHTMTFVPPQPRNTIRWNLKRSQEEATTQEPISQPGRSLPGLARPPPECIDPGNRSSSAMQAEQPSARLFSFPSFFLQQVLSRINLLLRGLDPAGDLHFVDAFHKTCRWLSTSSSMPSAPNPCQCSCCPTHPSSSRRGN
ncbi:hypothetical protein TWF569_004534 [Orbilia oligospora]|uniref:Uncharacterized protein n=1 Tax=Orbilia oligospora TaxID=2813651 RepID=A0A7C8NQR2_ORBOL|nr:hypothetical protein TWF102_006072 [Orbilia oligospora]KAF3098571.1 hypothetical protein TWF103_009007 [Orbilia oligospora]KAF3115170.1 hypothetical protein TWF706_007281 [Orbilia oligospora]KAF3126973.1 hypothetical protein TWF703_010264 [Orbilia oligospora]KAF3144279.1 hypothetical protein TWF594_004811 [Orbilia oligospora]